MQTLELAGCIIQQEAGHVLLIHRNTPQRTQWEIPGGKLNPGEDAVSAAVREVEEELGIEVEVTEQIGRCQFGEDGYTMVYSWFRAKISAGAPAIREPQTHDGWRYFTAGELADMAAELSPNTASFLHELHMGRISL